MRLREKMASMEVKFRKILKSQEVDRTKIVTIKPDRIQT